MTQLFISFCFLFSVLAGAARVSIHNISQDKDATHKALDYEREKDLKSEKRGARLELKEYRRRIYQLKKEIAFEKEQAREYITEAKALRAELKEDIKKRNKLKETADSSGGAFASFASQVVLGADVTDREGDKKRLHAYNQLIKIKKQKIRELRAAARKFIKNQKIKKLEIAELRSEMGHLSEDHGLKTRRRVSSQ